MTYQKQNSQKYRQRQTFLPKLKSSKGPKVSTITPQQFVKGKLAGPQKKKQAAPMPRASPSKPPAGPPWGTIGTGVDVIHKDSEGYYARFGSRSDLQAPPYVTRVWTVHSGRFSPGDISCNCKGWIFNKDYPKRCRHTDEMRELMEQNRKTGTLP